MLMQVFVQVSFDKEPEKASYVMTQELADSAGTVKSTVSADVTISEAATENVESKFEIRCIIWSKRFICSVRLWLPTPSYSQID